MAARVPSLTSVLLEPAPTADDVEAVVGALRAEHDATTEGRARARLLSTMAAIHEARDDLAAAARDELAATNAEPALLEPLESLIGIARRRRSQKNLDKLVERLARVARTGPERQRSAFELATRYLALGQLDDARDTLERSLAEAPDDAAAWLALEVLAGRAADPGLRERALTGRVGVTGDAEWRALLLLDCARLREEAGDPDACLALLRQAKDEHLTLYTLGRWERSATRAGRPAEAREASEAAAELLERALGDAGVAQRHSVPEALRSREHVAAAWLRASEWARREGDLSRSAALLHRAAETAPNERLLEVGRLLTTTEPEAREDALRARLAQQPPSREAGALWLRVFDSAHERGDASAAAQALNAALEAAPESLRARALHIERLEAEPTGAGYVALQKREAEAGARAPALAFAALVSALDYDGNETTRREASSQAQVLLLAAREAGMSALVSAELGRILASHCEDTAWYEQATEELLPHVAGPERNDLLGELARARLLRSDFAGVDQTLEGLESSTLTSATLQAYVTPQLQREQGHVEPRLEHAGRWEATLRRRHGAGAPRGDGRGGLPREVLGAALAGVWRQLSHRGPVDAQRAAQVKLRTLHEEAPESPAVTAALADMLTPDDPGAAAAVLARSAELQGDDALAAAWHLRASVLSWRTSKRGAALQQARKANTRVSQAAAPWLTWLLRALGDEGAAQVSSEQMSSAQGAPSSLDEDRGTFAALEHAAARLHRGDGALDELERAARDDDAAAWLLALASPDLRSAPDGTAPWEELEARSEVPAGTLSALAYGTEASARGDAASTEATLAAAKEWALCGGGLDAMLAWLTEAQALGRADEDAEARSALGTLLGSEELRASGALLRALDSVLRGLPPETGAPEVAFAGDAPSRSAAVRWAELELSPVGGDLGARADALEALARPRDEADAVQDETLRPTLLSIAAFDRLTLGQADEARTAFREVTASLPDLLGWEGLRQTAVVEGDKAGEAEACVELAKRVSSDEQAATLWEHAGVLYQDDLGDTSRAEEAFAAALARDYRRDTSFARLFRLVRARGDRERLLELVEGRLGVTEERTRLLELLWEKARLARDLGDREGSSQTLDALLELDPTHLGGLALASELHLTDDRFERAADLLARFAEHPDAPSQQRLLGGLMAAELYEQRSHNPARSFEILTQLDSSLLLDSDRRADLVERRAFAATRAGLWQEAAAAFEELHAMSLHGETRLRAASFLLAIARDELRSPAAAYGAAVSVLAERADDADAIAYLLASEGPADERRYLLEQACDACLASLRTEPLDEPRLRLFLRLCEALGNQDESLVALGALAGLGVLTDPERRHLELNSAAAKREPLTELTQDELSDVEAASAHLLPSPKALPGAKRLASTLTAVCEPTLEALGVGALERVDPFSDDALRAAIASWANAVGLADFDLYVGGQDPEGVRPLALSLPTLVVGHSVRTPLEPKQRAAVATALFSLARGTSPLINHSPEEGAALLGAAAHVVGSPGGESIPSSSPELEARLERSMEPELRGELATLWQSLSGDEVTVAAAAAHAHALSFGALAAGEPSVALASARHLSGSPLLPAVMSAVFAFALSPEFRRLRAALGMESS
jgi:hypothetical protein